MKQVAFNHLMKEHPQHRAHALYFQEIFEPPFAERYTLVCACGTRLTVSEMILVATGAYD